MFLIATFIGFVVLRKIMIIHFLKKSLKEKTVIVKTIKKFVSKQCEKTLKSPSKSPFLKVNVEEFNSHPKRKLQFEKDKMTSKSKKMGIPDIFKNISFDEPILPRGLKTLKDSLISVKQEQSTKTKYISPPSTKKLPIIHSKSKRSMVQQDSKNIEKSLSKNDGLSNDEETPTPLYKQYLQYLSVEEAEICNKGLVDGYNVYNDEPYATGVGGLSITLRDYVPKDTGHVEQQKDMALKLLAKASKCVQHIPPLFQLLKDVTSFEMEVCETLKQMNGHDCGMYVIKYMENDHVSQWKKFDIRRRKCEWSA
ncbi:Ubiquitin-like-specific protease ESD4 [Bienertia sinuspersici]